MSDKLDQDDEPAEKQEAVRALAEQALEAEAVGDEEKAERLFTEAENTHQVATITVLQEAADADDPVTSAPSPGWPVFRTASRGVITKVEGTPLGDQIGL